MPSISELTPEQRRAVLTDLSSILGGCSNPHELRKWSTSGSGSIFGDQAVVGTIFWKKIMGRPSTAQLCEGFSVLVYGTTGVPVPEGPGTQKVIPVGTPLLATMLNGAEDTNYFRVHFIQSHLTTGKEYVAIPSIVPGHQWAVDALSEVHKTHIFSPPDLPFTKPEGAFRLDTIEVLSR